MNRMQTPNVNERDPNVALEYIVLHYTGMQDAASAAGRLCDPASKVSVHYIVDEDGAVLQLAEESKRAWHAGVSLWRGQKDMNSASIGIELVNPGHAFGYRQFPSAQIIELKSLVRAIIQRHHLSPALALLGHSDIAPGRKQDPGEFFPWRELASEGLGLWPLPSSEDFLPPSEAEVLEKLGAIGYDTLSARDALLAFQRRYYPLGLSGKADAETAARVRALLRAHTAERLSLDIGQADKQKKQSAG